MGQKVIHIFPSESWGGAEIYAIELATQQLRSGQNVVLWCKSGTRMHQAAMNTQLPVCTDPIPKGLRLGYFLSKTVTRLLDEGQTTQGILHLHWAQGVKSFFGVKWWVKKPVKVMLHVHMWLKHSKKGPIHQVCYRALDRVVVAGPRAREAILGLLPVTAQQISIVPYAVPSTELPIGGKLECRSRLKLPAQAFIFGVFARIDRQKGVKEFLLALEPVLKNYPHAMGMVVGDPTFGEREAQEYLAEVTDCIEQSPYKDRILRFPFRADFIELLGGVDVMVAPSYQESYSLIFLNAFSVGVPAISTLAGGTPDLVKPEFGWLVEPRAVKELSEQMSILINHPEDVRRKGDAAAEFTKSHHSYSTILKLWQDLYKALESQV